MCIRDDCDRTDLERRGFLTGAAVTLATSTILSGPAANAQARQAETRVLDDSTIQHGKVTFKHNRNDSIDGYLARPKAEGVYNAVLVIAGNRITEEYIPNTCAALAVAGFVGLAPNIFHPLPENVPNTREAYDQYLANHTELDIMDDIQSGVSYLRSQAFVKPGGIGMVGFCMGGRIAMLFGARSREVDAVVPFHPAPMKQSEITRLRVPVQIHHGTADRSVAASESQNTEKLLKAQGTPIEVFLYEGCDHGFLAYTRPFYKPEAARLAWTRTTQFLKKNL